MEALREETEEEMRHTQATLLISSGADIKTVQNRLSHSSASLTMNINAHAIEQNDEKAAVAMESMLGGHAEDAGVAPLPATDAAKPAAAEVKTKESVVPPEVAKAVTEKVLVLFSLLPESTQLTRREICERCGIKSPKRCKVAVRQLMEEGHLVKNGVTKGVTYGRA